MADFYCDHENTSLYPTAYMATPASSASLPQDGDGKATGSTTPAVSSASWDLTSASASSGTMTVMGASITGLTASGSALASAIATAINASTAAITAANGNITSVYLKALVWATTSGAVLTVYSRIASDGLNYSINTACQMATGTGWTSPPANAQFSGGVSGPFRYLFNTTALATAVSASVSGAVGTYGAMPATVMGAVAAGDTIHIRTKRSGSNVTLTWPTAASCYVTIRTIGTLVNPLTFLADNGVKWPGDAGVFTMTCDSSLNYHRSIAPPASATTKQVLSGVNITETARNWRHELTGVTIPGNYAYRIGSNLFGTCFSEIRSMEFVGASGGAMDNVNSKYAYLQLLVSGGSALPKDNPASVFVDLIVKTQAKTSPIVAISAVNTNSLRMINCVFDHTGITQASTEVMVSTTAPAGGTGHWRYEAIGCRWVGFTSSANLSGWNNFDATKKCTVILRDCSFDNIKIFGGSANGGIVGNAESATSDYDLLCSIQTISTVGNRPTTYETFRKAWGWFDSAAPKTSGSVLPDGATSFSIRCAVTSEAGNVGRGIPVLFPRMGKINSLADGSRTAKLRLLVDNNIKTAIGSRDPNNAELFISITYVGTDGLPKTVTTQANLWDTPTALSAGTAGDWSATSYDVNGVTHNYSPYEISLSLPNLKGYSELGLVFGQGCQSSSVDNYVFLDPEWSLT